MITGQIRGFATAWPINIWLIRVESRKPAMRAEGHAGIEGR